MEKKDLFTTREVAQFLKLNEKLVYSLIAEKGLPATKVTGKWLFPRHLVEQWVENQTLNYPKMPSPLPPYHGLVIISGSNDILLERTLSLFNRLYPEHAAVFGNLGSQGGIRALRRNLCHLASSHLVQQEGEEYNFNFAMNELGHLPAAVNFCKREQGLLLAKGNPKKIQSLSDLCRPGIRIVNRGLGTGTRLLFDRKLQEQNIKGEIEGYREEMNTHLDVGLQILTNRADAGPGIRAVAGILDLDFISWGWERFDLLALRDRFFDKGVQLFLGLLHEQPFRDLVKDLRGYDVSLSGKMVFPLEAKGKEEG